MSSTPQRYLRVGQLAEQSGKTVRAIHFYEEMGLLSPARRTQSGYRQYGDDAVLRIHWIDRLQELGFSLADIRNFLSSLHARESGPAAMDDLRAFYAAKLIETRSALVRLRTLERELQDSLGYLSTCQTCQPETPRSACRTCDDTDHDDPPALIAAVHEAPTTAPEQHSRP